jgi:hypothetical protein
MRFLVTTSLALWGAMLVSGCDGGAGPATSPFSPFGTDPSGSAPEPAGGSTETPPGGGGQGTQSIAQLCAAACAHIEASCPTYQSANCGSGCTSASTQFPNCAGEFEAFVNCVIGAQVSCSGQSVDVPGCASSQDAVATCEGAQGTTTTSTGTGGAAP